MEKHHGHTNHINPFSYFMSSDLPYAVWLSIR
jgi:hypothetical protein